MYFLFHLKKYLRVPALNGRKQVFMNNVIFEKLKLVKIDQIRSSDNINNNVVRLLSKLASVGVYINNSNRLLYSDASADMVLGIMEHITNLISDNAKYNRQPLFTDFPNQFLNNSIFDLTIIQIIHYLYGIRIETSDPVINEPLDMSIAVTDGLYIDLLDETEYNKKLTEVLLDAFSMTVVWSEVNKAIVNSIIRILDFNIASTFIAHRENAMYVYANILDPNKLGDVLIGPTDVIKYIEYVCNPLGVRECRYRMDRKMKRNIMMSIDKAYDKPSFEISDVSRNYSTWKLLASIIHPFDKRYKKYTNAVTFFDTILNNGITSKYALLEIFVKQLADYINTYEEIIILYKNTGLKEKEYAMLLRAYGRILSKYIHVDISAFNEFIINDVLPKVSTNGLFSFLAFANKVKSDNEFDIIFPMKKNFIVKDSKHYDVKYKDEIFTIQFAIMEELNKRFKNNNDNSLMFIDVDAYGYKLPNGNRNSTVQKKDIPKLSTIDIPSVDTIRLFLSWHNTSSIEYKDGYTVDLDLSVASVNEQYNVNTCWYGNQASAHYTHSGDLKDAPITSGGATEYIDIDLKGVQGTDTKFVLVYVNLYNADNASKLSDLSNAEFGIMYRTSNEKGELYEESTVLNSIDLTGIDKKAHVPMIIDIKNNKIVYLSTSIAAKLTSNIDNLGRDTINKLEIVMNNNTITSLENIHEISWVKDSSVTDSISDANIVITDNPIKYNLTEDVKVIKPWDIELVALFKE